VPCFDFPFVHSDLCAFLGVLHLVLVNRDLLIQYDFPPECSLFLSTLNKWARKKIGPKFQR
jgi:hypothetical protein